MVWLGMGMADVTMHDVDDGLFDGPNDGPWHGHMVVVSKIMIMMMMMMAVKVVMVTMTMVMTTTTMIVVTNSQDKSKLTARAKKDKKTYPWLFA